MKEDSCRRKLTGGTHGDGGPCGDKPKSTRGPVMRRRLRPCGWATQHSGNTVSLKPWSSRAAEFPEKSHRRSKAAADCCSKSELSFGTPPTAVLAVGRCRKCGTVHSNPLLPPPSLCPEFPGLSDCLTCCVSLNDSDVCNQVAFTAAKDSVALVPVRNSSHNCCCL